MAFPLNDQVYIKSFTPREYQVSFIQKYLGIYDVFIIFYKTGEHNFLFFSCVLICR